MNNEAKKVSSRNMKPDELNPKAREAFGKSLIDIGVAIFKSLMLLCTVFPLAAFLKAIFSSPDASVSLLEILSRISLITYLLIIAFFCMAFLLGHYFRKEGIRHLHELEE